MPYKKAVQRISTIFADEEFKKVAEYAKKKKLSMYALAKKAIKFYMEKNP
jgi:mevalonate pyrophosphate decarboxylase